MRGVRRTAAAAIALGVIAALVSSGTALAQSPTESPQEKVVFDVGVDSDITGLNPFNLCCGPDYEYLELVYDLAIGFSREDLSPAPRIVTEWTPSEDSMTWTMKVRDDATFHDGTPLTAEDVAFTFTLISKYKMPFYKDYFPFDPTFEVLDPTTVVWKSTEPTFAPEIPAYAPVLPKHIWGRFDTVEGTPSADEAKEVRKAVKEFENNPPIGSGPFRFEEWKKGQFLRFSFNDDWWGGDSKTIDEVVIRVYDSDEAMVQALRSGEIDFAEGVSPPLFNTLKNDPNITTHIADGGCWGNIAYNFGGQGETATNHPAIKDLRVRQAIAHAVNKQEIVDRVYQGTAVVGDSILMPGKNGFWYTDIPTELEYPYDPAKANQILDDAGYLDTDGDGVREMPGGGEPLNFEVMTITDVEGSVDTGRLLKGYLQEIGIGVKFITVNTNKAYDLWYTGEWDIYVWDWCPDPDPDFMLSVFTTDQCLGWSDGCYSNPEYDKLYEAQQRALDRNERKAIIDQMQLMIAEQLPVMVLNYWSDLQAYRSEWTGFRPSPNVENGLLLFGYTTVDTYLELTFASEQAPGTGASPGLPAWVWIAVAGGVVVVIGGAIAARRRRVEDEA
ncbi:MAG: ABC transporter substrate-binding protein [Actinomycetota bacterium]|jgi:peptide/nickel transport system substrate-binding protein|nr:MAG: ABC transporter substrate-binding protein [Actinomycetota bacterium]